MTFSCLYVYVRPFCTRIHNLNAHIYDQFSCVFFFEFADICMDKCSGLYLHGDVRCQCSLLCVQLGIYIFFVQDVTSIIFLLFCFLLFFFVPSHLEWNAWTLSWRICNNLQTSQAWKARHRSHALFTVHTVEVIEEQETRQGGETHRREENRGIKGQKKEKERIFFSVFPSPLKESQ